MFAGPYFPKQCTATAFCPTVKQHQCESAKRSYEFSQKISTPIKAHDIKEPFEK
jgi:hypothetical protein